MISISLQGVLAFAGIVSKLAYCSLTGVFSATGTLNAALLKLKSVGGILSFSGSIGNILTPVKALSGSLSFSGSIFKLTSINLIGIITFSGNIGKTIKIAIAGVISFIGNGIGKLLGIGPQEIVTVSGEFTQLVSLSGNLLEE